MFWFGIYAVRIGVCGYLPLSSRPWEALSTHYAFFRRKRTLRTNKTPTPLVHGAQGRVWFMQAPEQAEWMQQNLVWLLTLSVKHSNQPFLGSQTEESARGKRKYVGL